jgi:hypothetical protein
VKAEELLQGVASVHRDRQRPGGARRNLDGRQNQAAVGQNRGGRRDLEVHRAASGSDAWAVVPRVHHAEDAG